MQPDQTLSSANPAVKQYIATLKQTSTEPPTVTVLKNTLGDVLWTYEDVGTYSIVLENAFTENKTTIIIQNNDQINLNTAFYVPFRATPDQIYILTMINATPTNGMLFETPIEIKVYQ